MEELSLMVSSVTGIVHYIPFAGIQFVTVDKLGRTVIFSDDVGAVTTKAPLSWVINTVWA